jgi:transposase InsO family protein
MRIHNKTKGVRGMMTMYEYALKSKYMITQKVKERVQILTFWKKYGIEATKDTYGVKIRSLYNWKKKLREGNNELESLNDKSRVPQKKRKRIWDIEIIEEIERIREKHPNLGAEKIYPLLKVFCENINLKCPKSRTIARLIKDLGGLRKFPKKVSHFGKIKKVDRKKKLRKPKGLKAKYPGHLVALDTIVKYINGKRKYIITFEDIYTRFGFSIASTSHSSLTAKKFFLLCKKIFPYSFQFLYVLTDNGSEFMKHFVEELKRQHLIHYHTYPKCPKMNSHIERFNRTIQEEFINYHISELSHNIKEFNNKMIDYLIWYNCDRVHFAFKNKFSPIQFMLSLLDNNQKSIIIKNISQKCNLGWHYTNPIIFLNIF